MQNTYKVINAFICQPGNDSVTPVFGDIEISGGKITKIVPREFTDAAFTGNSTDANVYDAHCRMLTVPLVNFHDHIYSRLGKGLNITGDMSNFPNVLKNLWWKLDQLLDEGMNNASAEMTALESIRNGVTYIFDHHASPNETKGSLRTIKQALKKYGLRGVLCFETTNRYGEEKAKEGLEENLNFALNESDDDFKGMIGLHASFTVDDSVLQRTREAIETAKTGVHVHLCEDVSDRVASLESYGASPVERFIKAGVINDKSIFAHCIHLTDKEIAALGEYKPAGVFNICSNLNNQVGLAPYHQLQKAVTMLAGTDGMHADLSKSAKQLFLLARHTGMSMNDAFGFFIQLYFSQLSFIKKYFPDYTSLQAGDRADFIIWDYVPPTPLTGANFFGHYIYGALEYPVRTVVQGGEFLMKDHIFAASDQNEVQKEIFKQGSRLAKKFAEG